MARSAPAEGVKPATSIGFKMKASIGLRAQALPMTSGISGRLGGTNDQCPRCSMVHVGSGASVGSSAFEVEGIIAARIRPMSVAARVWRSPPATGMLSRMKMLHERTGRVRLAESRGEAGEGGNVVGRTDGGSGSTSPRYIGQTEFPNE